MHNDFYLKVHLNFANFLLNELQQQKMHSSNFLGFEKLQEKQLIRIKLFKDLVLYRSAFSEERLRL